MFASLTDRFSGIISSIKGKAVISEDDLKSTLREIRVALLEADVSLDVVKKFINSIGDKIIGQDVLKKRRTEIDYLTGYVSKIGKSNRIPTPFCNKITEIVNNLGVGFDPSPDHLKDLERMLT